MNALIGFRLRQARLARSFSQEGLCRGICAVSYLSKIEQGRVEPGDDILRLLFERLHMTYENDPALLGRGRALLRAAAEKALLGEDCEEEAKSLASLAPRLELSELCLASRLVAVLLAEEAESAELLASLSPFERYMDEGERFLCALLHGWYDEPEPALARLSQADALRPLSIVSHVAAQRLYCVGRYQESLRYCAQGYARASAEGCLAMLRELSFLEGSCYANLYDHALMQRAYARTAALCRDDPIMLAHIDYNIGASFLEKARWAEAMPLLARAWAVYGAEGSAARQEERCMALHKLALCAQALGQHDDAARWLSMADREAEGLPEGYGKMVRLAALRMRPDYNDDEEYFLLLRELCDTLGKDALHQGYRRFHIQFLLEALTHRRRYREAYLLLRELSPMFSQE